jgi:hypothetical protein
MIQSSTTHAKSKAAASMKMHVFWNVAPCSLVETDRRFRCVYCLHHQRTSDTTVNFYQATWRNIPEDSHLHSDKFVTFQGGSFVLRIVWSQAYMF